MRAFMYGVIGALTLGAAAHGQTVTSGEPDRLVELIQEEGYRATLTTDGAGDPLIEIGMQGVNVQLYFFNCTNNVNCEDVLFSVGFDLDVGSTFELMNEWNQSKLFGVAYLDDENDPFLDYVVNMEFGITERSFIEAVRIWESALGDFQDHIGWS